MFVCHVCCGLQEHGAEQQAHSNTLTIQLEAAGAQLASLKQQMAVRAAVRIYCDSCS